MLQLDLHDPVIPLEYADGYKLRAVYMSSTTAPATNADVEITDRFVFDGGQRDTHYDLARIILKPGENSQQSTFSSI